MQKRRGTDRRWLPAKVARAISVFAASRVLFSLQEPAGAV